MASWNKRYILPTPDEEDEKCFLTAPLSSLEGGKTGKTHSEDQTCPSSRAARNNHLTLWAVALQRRRALNSSSIHCWHWLKHMIHIYFGRTVYFLFMWSFPVDFQVVTKGEHSLTERRRNTWMSRTVFFVNTSSQYIHHRELVGVHNTSKFFSCLLLPLPPPFSYSLVPFHLQKI